jgi:hypothetical protein
MNISHQIKYIHISLNKAKPHPLMLCKEISAQAQFLDHARAAIGPKSLATAPADSPALTRLTASSLNSAAHSCFGIFFIAFLSNVIVILRTVGRRFFGGRPLAMRVLSWAIFPMACTGSTIRIGQCREPDEEIR